MLVLYLQDFVSCGLCRDLEEHHIAKLCVVPHYSLIVALTDAFSGGFLSWGYSQTFLSFSWTWSLPFTGNCFRSFSYHICDKTPAFLVASYSSNQWRVRPPPSIPWWRICRFWVPHLIPWCLHSSQSLNHRLSPVSWGIDRNYRVINIISSG